MDRAEPCGTIAHCSEEYRTKATRFERLHKNSEIQLQRSVVNPYEGSLHKGFACHTLPKALDMSKDIARALRLDLL